VCMSRVKVVVLLGLISLIAAKLYYEQDPMQLTDFCSDEMNLICASTPPVACIQNHFLSLSARCQIETHNLITMNIMTNCEKHLAENCSSDLGSFIQTKVICLLTRKEHLNQSCTHALEPYLECDAQVFRYCASHLIDEDKPSDTTRCVRESFDKFSSFCRQTFRLYYLSRWQYDQHVRPGEPGSITTLQQQQQHSAVPQDARFIPYHPQGYSQAEFYQPPMGQAQAYNYPPQQAQNPAGVPLPPGKEQYGFFHPLYGYVPSNFPFKPPAGMKQPLGYFPQAPAEKQQEQEQQEQPKHIEV